MEFEGEIVYKWWEFSWHVWLPEGNQGFHDRTSSFGFGFQPTLMILDVCWSWRLCARCPSHSTRGFGCTRLSFMHWKPIFRICFVNLSSARKNTHQNYQKALTRSNKHEIALKFLKFVEFCPWWFHDPPSPRRINCQELYVKFIKDGEVPKELAWWGLPKVWGARLTRFPRELTVKDTRKTILYWK